MRILKLTALTIALYLVVVAFFYFTQRRLLYYPTHIYTALAGVGANKAFREISVRTDDGVDLKAWYAPASQQSFTIVFFHGNADSLGTAAQVADPFVRAGYGFLIAEYRGYSGLRGSPSEAGLYSDARALLRELLAHGVESRHIILFGHSLGTGVAVQMASEFRVGGLMLLAPYLSIPEVARTKFPFLPTSWLTLDRFDSEKKIASIRVPLLIVNGSEDEVIPPAQGLKLFSLAHEPKEFHSLPLRGHNDAFDDFTRLSLSWIKRACHAN